MPASPVVKPVKAERVEIEGLPLACAHCRSDLFVVQRANVWLGWLPRGLVRRRVARAFQCLRCSHIMLFR